MLKRDLEAAPNGTAEILKVIESYNKSTGGDFMVHLAEMQMKVKDVPGTVLHVALKIYLDKLSKDKFLHPNYFINTALKIRRVSKITKRAEVTPTSSDILDIGRSI